MLQADSECAIHVNTMCMMNNLRVKCMGLYSNGYIHVSKSNGICDFVLSTFYVRVCYTSGYRAVVNFDWCWALTKHLFLKNTTNMRQSTTIILILKISSYVHITELNIYIFFFHIMGGGGAGPREGAAARSPLPWYDKQINLYEHNEGIFDVATHGSLLSHVNCWFNGFLMASWWISNGFLMAS